MAEEHTTHIQRCLDRWKGGDAAAREELVRIAGRRLKAAAPGRPP